MQKIIVTVGLPASGKSTWAKEEVKKSQGKIKRVNKDDLRAMLDVSTYSKANEQFVLNVRDAIIIDALINGLSVISDDCNLAPKHIARFQEIAKGYVNGAYTNGKKNSCEVEIKDFTDVPLQECIKRDSQRVAMVGEKVILGMYNQFLRKPQPKYLVPNHNLPKVVCCDLDGTLSDPNGRNPYDASTSDQDLINPPVHNLLKIYLEHNVIEKIVFFSGREDKDVVPTIKFLEEKCGFTPDQYELHMRITGDKRKDSIIKKELFYSYIHGKFNPILWLDDRTQVVRMIRDELGVPVFQVNDGDF